MKIEPAKIEPAMKSALQQSFFLHATVAILFFILAWVMKPGAIQFQKVRIEIKEVPLVSNTPPPEPPVIQTAPRPVEPAKAPPRKVFGLNKNTIQSEKAGAVEVKAGNTIAKDIDQEKLNPEDDQALPIPAEEYLVTSMPRLKSEVRIPYPPQAKAKNIEGVVLMEVLIDDKGKVREARLIEGPAYGLTEAAMQAIYNFEFSPAVIDSKPVAVRIRYAYRFVLN